MGEHFSSDGYIILNPNNGVWAGEGWGMTAARMRREGRFGDKIPPEQLMKFKRLGFEQYIAVDANVPSNVLLTGGINSQGDYIYNIPDTNIEFTSNPFGHNQPGPDSENNIRERAEREVPNDVGSYCDEIAINSGLCKGSPQKGSEIEIFRSSNRGYGWRSW